MLFDKSLLDFGCAKSSSVLVCVFVTS